MCNKHSAACNYHTNTDGYSCARAQQLVVITSNRTHPAFAVREQNQEQNLNIVYQEEQNLTEAFGRLKHEYGCERLTLQSGATVNGLLLRERLIDFVDVVIAPVLVGGSDTPSLIDGVSLKRRDELGDLGVLELLDVQTLANSYLRVRYRVIS